MTTIYCNLNSLSKKALSQTLLCLRWELNNLKLQHTLYHQTCSGMNYVKLTADKVLYLGKRQQSHYQLSNPRYQILKQATGTWICRVNNSLGDESAITVFSDVCKQINYEEWEGEYFTALHTHTPNLLFTSIQKHLRFRDGKKRMQTNL